MKIFKISAIILQTPIYFTTLVLFKLFCRFTVSGRENLTALPSGIIFAANHSSEWDGILTRVALPFFSRKFSPMYYVSRTKEFYDYKSFGFRHFLYGGLLFRLLGAYPVYKGKKDYAYSLQHYLAIVQLKRNVCFFPEGRMTHDGNLGEAHGGVAFLSHTTNTPVVPVAIKGVFHISLRDFIFRTRTVEIVFGKSLSPAEIVPSQNPTVDDYKHGGTFVLGKIGELLNSR